MRWQEALSTGVLSMMYIVMEEALHLSIFAAAKHSGSRTYPTMGAFSKYIYIYISPHVWHFCVMYGIF